VIAARSAGYGTEAARSRPRAFVSALFLLFD